MADHDEAICRGCSRRFRYQARQDRPPPTSCGRLACRAQQEWGPDEWAGAARMARAREAAGTMLVPGPHGDDANGTTRRFPSRTTVSVPVVLSELDREAMRRAPAG